MPKTVASSKSILTHWCLTKGTKVWINSYRTKRMNLITPALTLRQGREKNYRSWTPYRRRRQQHTEDTPLDWCPPGVSMQLKWLRVRTVAPGSKLRFCQWWVAWKGNRGGEQVKGRAWWECQCAQTDHFGKHDASHPRKLMLRTILETGHSLTSGLTRLQVLVSKRWTVMPEIYITPMLFESANLSTEAKYSENVSHLHC